MYSPRRGVAEIIWASVSVQNLGNVTVISKSSYIGGLPNFLAFVNSTLCFHLHDNTRSPFVTSPAGFYQSLHWANLAPEAVIIEPEWRSFREVSMMIIYEAFWTPNTVQIQIIVTQDGSILWHPEDLPM